MEQNLNWDFFKINFEKNKTDAFELLSTLCFYKLFSINGGLPRRKNHPILETEPFKIIENNTTSINFGNCKIDGEIGFQAKYFEKGKLEDNEISQLLKTLKITKTKIQNDYKFKGIEKLKNKYPELRHIMFFSNVEHCNKKIYSSLKTYLKKNGILLHDFFESNFEAFLNEKENLSLKEDFFYSDNSVRNTEDKLRDIKKHTFEAKSTFGFIYQTIKTDLLNNKNKIFFIHAEEGCGKTTYAKQIETVFKKNVIYIPFSFFKENIYDFFNDSFIYKNKTKKIEYIIIDDYFDFQDDIFKDFIRKYTNKKNGFKIILLSKEKYFLHNFKSIKKINIPMIPKSFFREKINHKTDKETLTPKYLCSILNDQSSEIVEGIGHIKNNHLIKAIINNDMDSYFFNKIELFDFFIDKNILKIENEKIVFFNSNIEKCYHLKTINTLYNEKSLINELKTNFKNNINFHDNLVEFISSKKENFQENIFSEIYFNLEPDFNQLKEKIFYVMPKKDLIDFILTAPNTLEQDFIFSVLTSRIDFLIEDHLLIQQHIEKTFINRNINITEITEIYLAKIFPLLNEKEQFFILDLILDKYKKIKNKKFFSNIKFFKNLLKENILKNDSFYSIFDFNINLHDDFLINYIKNNKEWTLFDIFLKKIFFDIQISYKEMTYLQENNSEKILKIKEIFDFFYSIDSYYSFSILKGVKNHLIENNLYNDDENNILYINQFESFFLEIKTRFEKKSTHLDIISQIKYFNEHDNVIELIRILNLLFFYFFSGSFNTMENRLIFKQNLNKILFHVDLEKKDIIVLEDYFKNCLLTDERFQESLALYADLFAFPVENRTLKQDLLFSFLFSNIFLYTGKEEFLMPEDVYNSFISRTLSSLTKQEAYSLLIKFFKISRNKGCFYENINIKNHYILARVILFFYFSDNDGPLFHNDFLQKRLFFSVKKTFFVNQLENEYDVEIFSKGMDVLKHSYYLKIQEEIKAKYTFNIEDKTKLIYLIKNSNYNGHCKENENNNPLALYLDIYIDNIRKINPSIEELVEIFFILQKRKPFSNIKTNILLKHKSIFEFEDDVLNNVFFHCFFHTLITKETKNNIDILTLFCAINEHIFVLEKDFLDEDDYSSMIKHFSNESFYKENHHLKEKNIVKNVVAILSIKDNVFKKILDKYF